MLPYRREILPKGDGTWFARVVELPGCMAEGATQLDTLEALDLVMRDVVRVQLEDGTAIPRPSAQLAYNGKILIRLPRSVHRDLAERAERENVSINAFALQAIARALGDSSHHELTKQNIGGHLFSSEFGQIIESARSSNRGDELIELSAMSAPEDAGASIKDDESDDHKSELAEFHRRFYENSLNSLTETEKIKLQESRDRLVFEFYRSFYETTVVDATGTQRDEYVAQRNRFLAAKAIERKIGSAYYERSGRRSDEPTRDSFGPAFYAEIAQRDGQKVKDLIEQGKRAAGEAVREAEAAKRTG